MRDTDGRLFVAFWYNIISKSLGNSSDGWKKMNEDIQNTSSNRGNEKQTRTTLKKFNFVLL